MLVRTSHFQALALASLLACAPTDAHANDDGARSVALKSAITMKPPVAEELAALLAR